MASILLKLLVITDTVGTYPILKLFSFNICVGTVLLVGLPTDFRLNASPNRATKAQKKTFHCKVCDIELNSEVTMISHVRGDNHLKNLRKISDSQLKGVPTAIPIPNPPPTRVKVPTRLHAKIREAREPVIGLGRPSVHLSPSIVNLNQVSSPTLVLI